MHETICAFPNKALYKSKLVSDSSVAKHLLADLNTSPIPASDDDALTFPVVFFDTSGCEYFEKSEGQDDEGSKSNENEAVLVKKWVNELVCSTAFVCEIYSVGLWM